MGLPKAIRWKARDWVLGLLAVAAFGLAIRFYWHETTPAPTVHLTMTAGDPNGLRHRMARTLAQDVSRHGLAIEVVGSAGSEEALEKVDRGTFDAAFIAGGLSMQRFRHTRQIAALHIEPLHLLVKGPLFEPVSRDLTVLKGKRINLQTHGSGTHWLGMEVLEFAGLKHPTETTPGDYEVGTLSFRQLEAATRTEALPDAVFLTSSLPSPVARHLVTNHGFRLLPLPFAEAFALGALEQEVHEGVDPDPVGREVRKEHVYDATIPAFTYGIDPAVPSEAIHTLGTRLVFVANENLDPSAVGRLIDAVFTTRFAKIAHPALEPKLLELPPEAPLHAGTVAYLERNKPLITGDVFDGLDKFVSIGGAVLGGLLCGWQWVRQHYRHRQDLGFETYMLRVSDIEHRAMGLELSSSLPLRSLLALQAELGALKGDALEKFAAGELEGAELMSGFMSHVNDARDYLTRLILHERDNLEEQAREQGVSVRQLWELVLNGDGNATSSGAPEEVERGAGLLLTGEGP